jgi:hypothetical protein
MIRDLLLGLLGYTIAAPSSQKPASPPRKEPQLGAQRRSMRVSEAVGMSRIPRSEIGVTTTATIGASQAFSPSRPAPGIVPDGVKPMAMDDNFAWLAGQSQYTENLGWLGMPFLAELSQRAEYRQIVETIVKDMTRRWIKITAQGDGRRRSGDHLRTSSNGRRCHC